MRAPGSAFLALWLLACAGPPPVASDPVEFEPSGPYLHRITGLVVPERVGSFERRAVTRYDPEGFSVSARYESREPRAVVRFHHYPASGDGPFPALEGLRAQFESAKHAAYRNTWRAQFVHEQRIDFVINGVELPGMHAVFRHDTSSALPYPLESHLWLFAVGDWYLKFHVTSPQEEAPTSFEAQKRFIASFEWQQPP